MPWYKIITNQVRLDSLLFGHLSQYISCCDIEEWPSLEHCEKAVIERYCLPAVGVESEYDITVTELARVDICSWIERDFASFFQ